MGGFGNQNWGQLANSQGEGGWVGCLAGLFGQIGGGASGVMWGQGYGPDEEGWFDYINGRPPEKALCQFKLHDDGVPWVGYITDLHPQFNAAYLKWRLTGIAKESGFNDWSR